MKSTRKRDFVDVLVGITIGIVIVIFLSFAISQCIAYKQNPAFFEAQSYMPWYFGIVTDGSITAIVVAVLLFLKKLSRMEPITKNMK